MSLGQTTSSGIDDFMAKTYKQDLTKYARISAFAVSASSRSNKLKNSFMVAPRLNMLTIRKCVDLLQRLLLMQLHKPLLLSAFFQS